MGVRVDEVLGAVGGLGVVEGLGCEIARGC